MMEFIEGIASTIREELDVYEKLGVDFIGKEMGWH
jgi:hypothetical protein